jgi:hypothetical protein
MQHARIEWVLGNQCHRLICVVQSAKAGYAVTVYFDGLPVRCRDCPTRQDVWNLAQHERTEWQAKGWSPVEVEQPSIQAVPETVPV